MTILNIVIIRCSKYEEEGPPFVTRHWRGSLPSNTLATMYGLVQDLTESMRLGADVRIVQHVFDDSVQVVRPSRIAWLGQLWGAKTLVMLVGVQTNQMVRAHDLALDFRGRGADVIIGGFHPSGVISWFGKEDDPDHVRAFRDLGNLQTLLDAGVSLFAGETEGRTRDGKQGRIEELLRACLDGVMLPIYNYLDALPQLAGVPMPISPPHLRKRFVSPDMGTLDTSRGCPFQCKFCCIRIVQGQTNRSRSVVDFVDAVRSGWRAGIRSWFFTSDDFARDKQWKAYFEALIELQKENIFVNFMVQVDTKAHKLTDFVRLAAQAGCQKAFIGLESINDANTMAVGKKQNSVAEVPAMIKAWHDEDIQVFTGYMVGMPFDTPDSIASSIDKLIELEVDQLSLFIASPCAGAEDHAEMFRRGVELDTDMNRYTTVTPIVGHPTMSKAEISAAYNQAWQTMTSVDTLVRVLKRTKKSMYWRVFRNLVSYKHAIDVCRQHPMLSGLIPLRDRLSVRVGYKPMNPFHFFFYDFGQHLKMSWRLARFLRDAAEVWLQSRPRTEVENRLIDSLESRPHFRQWLSVRVHDVRESFRERGLVAPKLAKLLSLRVSLRTTRSDLDQHWTGVRQQLRRGKYWTLLRWKTMRAFAEDSIVMCSFMFCFLVSWRKL